VTGFALEIRALSVAYGSREVLTDISADVKPGELVCLLGPNGAGKSTLLRAVTGSITPSRGAVLIDGVPREEYERPALARRLAVVPGQTAVAFPMRVEELVALGRVPHEHPLLGPRAADLAAVERAIDRVGIGHLRGRDVRELSLGERQLVVLAMTIAQGARLLLLDEPTVHLDLGHQVAVMELLRDLANKDGVTVLAVLHDLALASHFFPRLMLMHRGRLVADGAPDEVLTNDRIREVFDVDPSLINVRARTAQTAAAATAGEASRTPGT
jgi:iron complex transport system ATP-binding protein